MLAVRDHESGLIYIKFAAMFNSSISKSFAGLNRDKWVEDFP